MSLAQRTHETVLKQSWPQSGNGVHLTKQDEHGDPFPIIRRMIACGEGARGYHVDISIWREEQGEYPPINAGAAGAGIRLDPREAAALWASLGEWLVRHGGEDTIQ